MLTLICTSANKTIYSGSHFGKHFTSTQKNAGDKAAFKPRKLNSKFRDRAAERREGINDYAEVFSPIVLQRMAFIRYTTRTVD